jgi:hypothetical protein
VRRSLGFVSTRERSKRQRISEFESATLLTEYLAIYEPHRTPGEPTLRPSNVNEECTVQEMVLNIVGSPENRR